MSRAQQFMVPTKGAANIIFLLREAFTTDESAPLTTPRTAVPGPGTLKFLDTQDYASITGGKWTTSDINGNNDPALWDDDGQTRAAGLAVYGKVTCNNFAYFGFGVNNTGRILRNSILMNNASLAIYDTSVLASLTSGDAVVPGTEYELGVVAMAGGGSHYLIKGGTYTDWTRLFISHTEATATLYGGYTPRVGGTDIHTVDDFSIFQLPTPWDTDTGMAYAELAGSRNAGDLFTHPANGHIIFDVPTLPSAGQIEIRFHVQDNQNYWQATIDSAGDFDLDEVVAGVATQWATSAAAVVAGNKVELIFDGAIYAAIVLNGTSYSREHSYSSMSNFNTEINAELETLGTGGAVSDIQTYTHTLTGAELSAWEARVNF